MRRAPRALALVFRDTEPPVHLLFLIGTPPAMVRDYLVCIGTLARLCRNRDMRERLLNAPTAERLIDELRAAIAVAAKCRLQCNRSNRRGKVSPR